MKFTQELKDKWLAALRSGDFKQGRGYLCPKSYNSKNLHYCCLGVLAEISGCFAKVKDVDLCTLYEYEGDSATDKLYFNGKYVILKGSTQNTLIAMNDSGQSFGHIADWIEANIPAEVE